MLLELVSLKSEQIDVTKFMFLVEMVAHKFRKKVEVIEDTEVYSIASLELVKAAKSFNPIVNTDFRRFAYKAMCNGVIEQIRFSKRKKRTVNLEPLTDKQWQTVPEHQQNPIFDEQLYKRLISSYSGESLQDKADKELLLEVYIHGKKIPIIAEEQGVTRATIYNRLNRIVAKIRKAHADLIAEENHECDEG
jgi:RNA polymerase sigma factor (sigma-70 family)